MTEANADFLQHIRDRAEGRLPNGDVWLLDFDIGIAETFGATLVKDTFFLIGLRNVAYATEYPGVPVVFDSADNAIRSFKLPIVVIQRTSVMEDLPRYHPFSMKYRAPAEGARQFEYQGRTGYDKYEEQESAFPYNITYSIQILARNRGTVFGRTRNSTVQGLLRHLMRCYPHYGVVYVRDSIAGIRSYHAFSEAPEPEHELLDVTGRIIGYRQTVRVEGELDLTDPFVSQAVTVHPTLDISEL